LAQPHGPCQKGLVKEHPNTEIVHESQHIK